MLSDSIISVVFETVFKALEQHQTLEFNYRPLQKTTFMPRKINPYHAVCQKGAWYILGYCHDKQEVRIFNFSRIQTPKLGKKFNVPSNFRPEDYFDKELGIWLSAKEKYTVELLIDKEIGTYALDRKFHFEYLQKCKKRRIPQKGNSSLNILIYFN